MTQCVLPFLKACDVKERKGRASRISPWHVDLRDLRPVIPACGAPHSSGISPGCCGFARMETWRGRRDHNATLLGAHALRLQPAAYTWSWSFTSHAHIASNSIPACTHAPPLNLQLYVRSRHPWQAEVMRVSSTHSYIMLCCSPLCCKPTLLPPVMQQLGGPLARLSYHAVSEDSRTALGNPSCSILSCALGSIEHWRRLLVEHHLPVSCGKIIKGSVKGC